MTTMPDPYRRFRFPAEINAHAVWLYHCFSLSLREVETILAQRGIVVSYESIGAWGLRFGRAFANALKRRRPRPGDKWHLDRAAISTTAPRSRPSRHGDESGRCSASSRYAMPSGSSPAMARSTTSPNFATTRPRPTIEPLVTVPFRLGAMSPASLVLPDRLHGIDNGDDRFVCRTPT